jgi:glycosyltransferase involved in cell wall biosynthesis
MLHIILIGTLPSSIINFRGELVRALVFNGYKVTAFASGASEDEVKKIKLLGAEYCDYPVSRSGLNPLEDFKTFLFLKHKFNEINPDIVLAYTIKPIIWGGLATRFSGVPKFYALVTGLGFAFQSGSFVKNSLMKVVKSLYRVSLKKAKGVIFQNQDNQRVFIDNKLVDVERCSLVNGSGVDLSCYEKMALTDELTFLLIARLLGDKGIREYVQAAGMVKAKYPNAIFNLVGPEDPSPDGISVKAVDSWHVSGAIVYHGGTDDVRPYIKESNIFVLPSYHEGMPRTVLEAMAMGRPILTTNVPGCKETVVNGENGWLVEKANVEQLAEKMIWFIENQGEWQRMGDISHQMAIEKFDVHKVNQELLKIMGLDK